VTFARRCVLGPGLFEIVYERAMAIELQEQQIAFQRQVRLPALYKEQLLGTYRIDFIVEESVLIEIKSVSRVEPVHTAQVLTYLKLTGLNLGLLLNFHSARLVDGIRRFVTEK
jgi:GxxExxY protein